MSKIKLYPSTKELILAAANEFVNTAAEAISQKGNFSVALSGGSTPQPLYEYLAQDPGSDNVSWDKIHFFWGDERNVLPDHNDSNYNQAFQTLLKPRQVPGENIHRIQGELEPTIAADFYQQVVLEWFGEGVPQFDLILLGMGSDGHTASLFPGTDPVIHPESYQLVAANYLYQQDTWRITMMPRLINAAKKILVMVSGQSKADSLYKVIKGKYLPELFPIQLIQPNSGDLVWMVDKDAASLFEE